jgi:signal transduction histidine kinase
MPLRWRLILFAWFLAFAIALFLSVLLHLRSERRLLGQIDKTLETKCDEVITVLEAEEPLLTLVEFLAIETDYRYSPYTYYYQIRDAEGRHLAGSTNLGTTPLPLPRFSAGTDAGISIDLRTAADPLSGAQRIRLRSERIPVAIAGGERSPVVIQTAVSLGPFESAVRADLLDTLTVTGASLAAVFFLLWFVTGRALKPVSAMASKAPEITATSLRERLPVTGRGDELDRLADVLNDMLDRLGSSLRQMEQFASGAAHQLRTPITRIRGELELLLRGELPEPDRLRDQLERIQEELERLSRVCGRLLLLARLDQQAAEAGLLDERTDLGEVVADLLEYMNPVARERNVTLRGGPTAAAIVRGSKPLLVEAVLNLLDNAIRYTPEGGSVSVSTEVHGDTVRLSVEDTGPGVPPSERESIFQPFYRLPRDAGSGVEPGNGLGLAIVMAIARAHRGSVELEGTPGGGSLFRLTLPAHLDSGAGSVVS